ncbi:type I-E CRISPR-associated protein Cas5/CasD [Streptomyces sp. NPDC093085]|uniref:type I-E CRISPR-associated protein Cas5/CasD n=1 Tax=Streptomyces sp. NPDC093085 TaxID=3155068 RepID=UPI003437ABCA
MTGPTRPQPQPGLLLRLTGPLQSWGERSHFNQRDTAGFPTRSGVIGLLASALGRRRDQPADDLARFSLTVRADRPGVLLRDLHTVGGGLLPKQTVTTAEGKKRGGDTGTLVSHRYYLADAAFTVALTATSERGGEAMAQTDLLARCAHALDRPRWPLYLGRRSCPPEGPVLLGTSDDALHHLLHLPLAAVEPKTPGTVEFFSDRPLDRLPVPSELIGPADDDGTRPSSNVNDEPLSFHPRRRAYRDRPLYRRTLHLPETPYAGLGAKQLAALDTYLSEHLTDHPARTEGKGR